MNIGIIGLGLIGGSYGLTAKRLLPRVTLFGTDRDPENFKEALALGLVQKKPFTRSTIKNGFNNCGNSC